MSLYAVSRHSGEPLYLQIARRLRADLQHLRDAAERLPSEPELAARFGVNRHTLRRAIDELVLEGLLERRQGLGVFVLDAHFDYPITARTRFTENLASQGHAATTRILQRDIVPAGEGVARRLEIATGQNVVWIESQRLVNGHPMCLVSHFLPQERFPNLAREYDGGSLHAFLESRHNCPIQRQRSLITASLPQGDDARWLAMPLNQPVLRVKSVNVHATEGHPVEYALTRFRADRVQLDIQP